MLKTCCLFVLLLACVGCATIIGGTEDPVTIQSEPSGAKVYIDGTPSGTTPVTVDLDTSDNHDVRLEKEGYKVAAFSVRREFDWWTLGNIVIFWVIGFVVDFADGAAWDFTKDVWHVNLDQETR